MPEQTITEESEENPFVAKFEQFFRNNYIKKIERLVERYPDEKSLEVDFKDLERFDYELADELLINPDYLLEAASLALENIHIPVLELKEFRPHIRFFNLPADAQPILRDISASQLNRLITVDGLVRTMTDVLPKLKVATWQCRRCDNKYKIAQGDYTVREPGVCECKHKDFILVPEESEFIDYQKIQIQEPLELLKGSEQATNLDVYVSEDLVNKIAPGGRTKISGILRLKKPKEKAGNVYGRYIEAIHLEETAQEFEDVKITKEEEEEIKKLSERKNIYEMLVKSIAPTIYGHEVVKEAIALQLFGGVKKVLPGDNVIRGNMHILLVGDPGMAKSSLLQAINKIAPKSIYIAGKTSTSAGISATAVKDEFGEGGWTLKAGAMVLASGGLCLIDELDKMDTEDRSALHEGLEQQYISVAKAGIVTRFKTETSVLAAANPKFSRFDTYMNFIDQVDLPVTLISRFDLLFLIRDVLDKKKDEEITSHILKTHQAGEMLLQKTSKKTIQGENIEEVEALVQPAIASELLRKYISYARQKLFPRLTGKAIDAISKCYLELREQGRDTGGFSATHRQLEGLIRMSEASARIRLSDTVEIEDAERAVRLLRSSLKEVVTDVETGKIDIDLLTTGTTHTQMTNLKKVLNIIKQKSMEFDKVPKEEIVEEAKTQGIEKEKCLELISKLQRQGDIYEPSHGVYKPTHKL